MRSIIMIAAAIIAFTSIASAQPSSCDNCCAIASLLAGGTGTAP